MMITRVSHSEEVKNGSGHRRRDQGHDDQHREESGREYVGVIRNVQHDQLDQTPCVKQRNHLPSGRTPPIITVR
jgi:hypothetical protein